MKAIETIYNGYKFRSRLEARWAVFFDTLGIEYEYEVEGFDLDGVWYLPDFWLPDMGCWVEIKPNKYLDDNLLDKLCDTIFCLTEGPDKQKALPVVFLGQPGNELRIINGYYFFFSDCHLCRKGIGINAGDVKEEIKNGQLTLTETPALFCSNSECGLSLKNEKCPPQVRRIIGFSNYRKHINKLTERYKPPDRVALAYQAARQARFEFGENGKSTDRKMGGL